MLGYLRRRRRARARSLPFPDRWRHVLARTVPLYSRMTNAQREELHGHIHILLDEKSFEGCGGLELTDEIRLTVAAHAALLLMGRETEYYPGLHAILVYPSSYRAPVTEHLEGGIVSEREEERLGESWDRGVVVIAWDAAEHGARDGGDGENVILHEFAHQIDSEDGETNGVPPLQRRSDYAAWAKALRPEYERLRSSSSDSLLDDYGSESPAEFFAVATEAYFERPHELRTRHRQLYEALRNFYRFDPAHLTAPLDRSDR